MPIITISRGSYSWGKEVAEKVAQRLGYDCIARDVILEASEQFDIPEVQLLHAIEDAPSFWERFGHGKEKYIAYIRSALLNHLQKGNIVYHGMAGHFFVRDVRHVLKVRIIANFDDRVNLVMERDGVSRHRALRFIENIDNQRRQWSKHLYGIDTWDPALYDLVLHIDKLTVQNAVDIITHTANMKAFQTTEASQQAMEDLALSARVKAVLIEIKPDIEVTSTRGAVTVITRIDMAREMVLYRKIETVVKEIPGVKEIHLDAIPTAPYGS